MYRNNNTTIDPLLAPDDVVYADDEPENSLQLDYSDRNIEYNLELDVDSVVNVVDKISGGAIVAVPVNYDKNIKVRQSFADLLKSHADKFPEGKPTPFMILEKCIEIHFIMRKRSW